MNLLINYDGHIITINPLNATIKAKAKDKVIKHHIRHNYTMLS
jgi:hypothetical protein